MSEYRCIALDPPWPEYGGGKSKRGADRHYRLMSPRRIGETVLASPSWSPAADCHLWMWTTKSSLASALWLIEQFGFRYVTSAVWVKMRSAMTRHERDELEAGCSPDPRHRLQVGLGQYTRGAHELLLLGTRGKAMVPSPVDRLPDVIFAERTRHSAKPDEAYALIERVSPGPRLEMFARASRSGWDVWGNEVAA